MYDPQIGRWHSVDPLAENSCHASPFTYVENNPISRIDLDGRDWYEDKDGNLMWRRSHDETYAGENGNEWTNVGQSAIFFHGNTATFFGQNEDEDGNLSLYSQSFSFEDSGDATEDSDMSLLATKNMQSSQWSRDGLQNYKEKPTFGNWFAYLGKEVLSQWADPEKVAMGLSIGVAGLSSMITGKMIVDDLIASGVKLPRVKGGGQVAVQGNINAIFNSLARRGRLISPNQIRLSNGTIITKYPAESGFPTFQINQGGKITKVRFQ